MVPMDEDKFDETYAPVMNEGGSGVWDAHEILAQKVDNTKVWTIVESDAYDGLDAIAGFKSNDGRHGPIIGYAVTEQPWKTGDERAEWIRWGRTYE